MKSDAQLAFESRVIRKYPVHQQDELLKAAEILPEATLRMILEKTERLERACMGLQEAINRVHRPWWR